MGHARQISVQILTCFVSHTINEAPVSKLNQYCFGGIGRNGTTFCFEEAKHVSFAFDKNDQKWYIMYEFQEVRNLIRGSTNNFFFLLFYVVVFP